jgi:hypothetical protein
MAEARSDSATPSYQTFARTTWPFVSVNAPATWTLLPSLVTNIILPIQGFSASSEAMTPRHSLMGAIPDFTWLSPEGVLVHLEIYPISQSEGYMSGARFHPNLSLQELRKSRDEGYPDFDQRIGWFIGTSSRIGYMLRVISGRGTPDMEAAEEVLRSISVTE